MPIPQKYNKGVFINEGHARKPWVKGVPKRLNLVTSFINDPNHWQKIIQILRVVYFDKETGASNLVGWSESTFSYFSVKNNKIAHIEVKNSAKKGSTRV